MRNIDETQNGKTVEIAADEEIEIVLSETASTGFRWQATSIVGAACAIVADKSEPPESSKPGAPGLHRWRLQAKKAGECELKLAYRRPWEASSDAAREFSIRIRVAP